MDKQNTKYKQLILGGFTLIGALVGKCIADNWIDWKWIDDYKNKNKKINFEQEYYRIGQTWYNKRVFFSLFMGTFIGSLVGCSIGYLFTITPNNKPNNLLFKFRNIISDH
jgi:hypothetical protein